MADNREAEAFDLAAQFILSIAGTDEFGNWARSFCLTDAVAFTDRQWKEIMRRVADATPMPDIEQWAAAYEVLDARGDAE